MYIARVMAESDQRYRTNAAEETRNGLLLIAIWEFHITVVLSRVENPATNLEVEAAI